MNVLKIFPKNFSRVILTLRLLMSYIYIWSS